jgi:hypothetical protein
MAWLRQAWGRLRMGRPPATLIELGAGDGTLMLRLARALRPQWKGVALTLLDRQRIVDAGTLEGFDALGWHTTVVCQDAIDWARSSQGAGFAVKSVAAGFTHHELGTRWPAADGDWWTDEFHAWPFSHAFLAARTRARAG